jgi:hypothetical protein
MSSLPKAFSEEVEVAAVVFAVSALPRRLMALLLGRIPRVDACLSDALSISLIEEP